jgi:hypothetical protein
MIQSIHIQNFQSHADTRIELAPGVNVITGETNNGKTSVLRAIKWVTQNRPRGDSMLTRQPKTGKTKPQPKPCRVTITTERGEVSRIREKGFNGYVLRVGDAPERRFEDVGASVPPEVLEVLNLGDVNVQEQLADFFLIKQSGGQVSKYVSGLLGFEVVDKALAGMKKLDPAPFAAKDRAQYVESANYGSDLARLGECDLVIEAIAETCDDDSIATFIRRLRFLFSEEDGAAKVTLCTIHKFKGMQAKRVWWLDENLCDESRCKSAMAAQETRNLRYVALTRSTSELHFVYSRDNRDR